MPFAERLYELGMRAGREVLPRAPILPEKLRLGLEGRKGLLARIERWVAAERAEGPLIWFHAPSVGEGLQTQPVIEALRQLRPDLQIFYTFFSPSAEGLARRLPVDYADYIPFDVSTDLETVIELVRPSAIVFGKSDVWPVVTRVARAHGVRLALVSATVASNSSRLRPGARAFLAEAYRRLDAAGAISVEDALRLARLGARVDLIEVTGDARFDQVAARAGRIDRGAQPVSLLEGHRGPTLVAGSTWPEGEAHIATALASLRGRDPKGGLRAGGLRAVLIPHEPTPDRLAALEARLAQTGLASDRLSQLEDGSAIARDVVVVDRVGALAELYAVADIAYVGGGFGRRGLHSVLEPAALGVPVIFGPRHANAREAAELIERGAAVEVGESDALGRALKRWLEEAGARDAAGRAAKRYVEENLGAGRRNAELVLRLLE